MNTLHVEFEGNVYSAEWSDDGAVLSVCSRYGNNTTHSAGSVPGKFPGENSPPPMARVLFIEILEAAKSRGKLAEA